MPPGGGVRLEAAPSGSLAQKLGLQPGDIISTGTPSGVALAMPEPSRYYLKPGDVVRATIERIGTLENTVVAEQSTRPRA